MATINETHFATHYLAATEWMLDGLSNPSAKRFANARNSGAYAKMYAHGDSETALAGRLLATVMDAARSHGYTGYGE